MPDANLERHGAAAAERRPFTRATVVSTTPLSPTVRSLVLRLNDDNDDDSRFTYQAGQWVDFMTDDLPPSAVGGFSMCAPPLGDAFAQRRELELAVKLSRHPAAQWVHDPQRCRPGAAVRVRAGGKFTLALADGEGGARCEAGVVFCAGGIGVTALAAMVGELCERWTRRRAGGEEGQGGPRRAAVLYSARSKEDLALLPKLRAWAEEAAAAEAARGGREGGPPLTLQLHVTGEEQQQQQQEEEEDEDEEKQHPGLVRWRRGRIAPADARAAVDALLLRANGGGKESGGGVFVCGPPQMTDELAAAVAEHPRVGQARVFTERWW